MRRRFGSALVGIVLVAGCGSPGAELFTVQRSGRIPGAALTLRVLDDGTVRCNGAPGRLPDRLLLTARDLARKLAKPARRTVRLPPAPGSVLSYSVRLPLGSVSFSDNSPGAPGEFAGVQLFTREAARRACGLRR